MFKIVHIVGDLRLDTAMYIHMRDDNGAICTMIRHLYASICT